MDKRVGSNILDINIVAFWLLFLLFLALLYLLRGFLKVLRLEEISGHTCIIRKLLVKHATLSLVVGSDIGNHISSIHINMGGVVLLVFKVDLLVGEVVDSHIDASCINVFRYALGQLLL